jgi:hypothetical protein
MTYKPKVYTASKIPHFVLWRKLKEDPDWDFVEWTASWVDHLEIGKENADGPIDNRTFRNAWIANINDVRRSDLVLLYCGHENALKGALVEAGAALSLGTPVVTVGLGPEHSWAFHSLVTRCQTLRDAREHLFRYTVLIPQKRRSENE